MQMLDELPMMYAMFVWGYIWIEISHPKVKNKGTVLVFGGRVDLRMPIGCRVEHADVSLWSG
jgi:hypothetical protein